MTVPPRRRSRAGNASGDGRAESRLPGSGSVIWPACRCPARTRWKAPGGSRSTTLGKWQSKMRSSASGSTRRAGWACRAGRSEGRRRRSERGGRGARRCATRRAGASRCPGPRPAGCRQRGPARAEVVVAKDCVAAGSRSSSSRSKGSPLRRERRSPLISIRSGCRSATQSTARSTARAPREGMPRWKSEGGRCERPRAQPAGQVSGSRPSEPYPAGLEMTPAQAGGGEPGRAAENPLQGELRSRASRAPGRPRPRDA